MSTLRSCPGGDSLVSLLYDDFEPGAVPSRDDLEAHVRACATCLAEFEALGGVRAQLAAWTAPDVALGFAVVRTDTRAPLGWRQTFAAWSARSARALPAAAAAIIVLGGAMALARLDIHYGQAGLTVRTGWGHAPSSSSPAPSGPGTGGDAAALRQELASLRGEVGRVEGPVLGVELGLELVDELCSISCQGSVSMTPGSTRATCTPKWAEARPASSRPRPRSRTSRRWTSR